MAAHYKLALPGFEERVTLLDGDCKRGDLGLSPQQWLDLARSVTSVFHLAANSSFVATYEVLRGEWMPSYVRLLEFCAKEGAALHVVGSVGRFAVSYPPNRTRRGVWTSGYMRQKAVQYELMERFKANGLTCSWTDCSYIIGSLESGGINPGFHDSMWKAAAIQRAVGVGFAGDATLVPVDVLVEAVWLNANQTASQIAPYMSLRLKKMLTSADIGVPVRVGPEAFREAAVAAGFPSAFINAFVPTDIATLVPLMHKPFEAPPHVAALFANIDEEKVIAANFEFAKAEFGQLESFLPRSAPRPSYEPPIITPRPGVSPFTLRVLRHIHALGAALVLLWHLCVFVRSHPTCHPLRYLAFLSNWTSIVHVSYLCLAARLTCATPPASQAATTLLTVLHNVALPASIAVVPLFWGQVLVPAYQHRTNDLSQYFVHGVNCLSMLVDFALCRRVWRFTDAKAVLAYGFTNMAFMRLYYVYSGCPNAKACDLDCMGHPYVYSVVDWRQPAMAAAACLLAILVPVPLISLLLCRLSAGRIGSKEEEDAGYPYGYNHNGTVALPRVWTSPQSVAEVRDLLRGEGGGGARDAIRAIGSAKSNTRCLEAPGRLLRVGMKHVVVSGDETRAFAGAGCTLRELARELAARGLQLYSAVEIGNLTAGAMAVSHTKNRHVPGEKGILSSYVVGVTLVDAAGRVHAIGESEHVIDGTIADEGVWGVPRELMRHVRCSHGLFGVVCEVEVLIKPLSGRSITHYTCRGAAAFAKKAREHSASGGSLFAYLSPYSQRYLVEVQKPATIAPRGNWFWKLREHFITVDYPLLFRLGDALPTPLASILYEALTVVGEVALLTLHTHESAPPHVHIGWHDHASWTKFQWTFLAFPLDRAEAVFVELQLFCERYKAETGYCNAYFVSYVMEADSSNTFSYAADGPVVTIDPIAANSCGRFLPFCEALVVHLQRTVGGLKGAFNQSIGLPPREMGRAVGGHKGAADFLAKRRLFDGHGRFLNPFMEEVLMGVEEALPTPPTCNYFVNRGASKERLTAATTSTAAATTTAGPVAGEGEADGFVVVKKP